MQINQVTKLSVNMFNFFKNKTILITEEPVPLEMNL